MSDLVLLNASKSEIPSYVKDVPLNETLSDNSFVTPSIRINTKRKFDLHIGKDMKPLDSASEFECVIVAANKHNSKRWYEGAYQGKDSAAAPTCCSMDGKTPDEGIETPVCASCVSCPKNIWGSAKSIYGKPSRLCGDYKRLAVCLYGDDTVYRLDIPKGSLKSINDYDYRLRTKFRVPYTTIVTKVSIDPDAETIVLKFEAVKFLTEEEYKKYSALGKSEAAINILTSRQKAYLPVIVNTVTAPKESVDAVDDDVPDLSGDSDLASELDNILAGDK